ncbi:MAG TPA: NUDIX domain-containing protein [Candidatus Dormibacteraeota bacterium]
MIVVPRPAARVIVLDPDHHVLLFKFNSVVRPGASWWLTPGGALDPGESHEEAALRELAEECGFSEATLGLCVWTREHEFDWKRKRYLQQERYFMARVPRFEVSNAGWTAEEVEVMGEHRWWTVAEILASSEDFAPRQLGRLLERLLRDGPPETPIDAGV